MKRQGSRILYIKNRQSKDGRVWVALLDALQAEIGSAKQRLNDLQESEKFIKGQIERGEPLPEWAKTNG